MNKEVIIKGYNIKGQAFGFIDDQKVFVNINAGINQTVSGILKKRRRKKKELINCQIIDYANKENMIFDIKEKQCGGCNYQYLSYDEQLKIKNDLVIEQIKGNINHEFIIDKPIKSVEILNYRNKMEFSFGNEYLDGPITLGLHKQNSFHDIQNVENLKLMDDNFNLIYSFSNNFFRNENLEFYHRIKHTGFLRNLVIRKSCYYKQILINIVTTSNINYDFSKYVNELLNLKLNDNYAITGIIHTINNNLQDTVISDKEIILYGKRDITEKILDLDFNISPYSFFQTNSKTCEKLYLKAIEYLKEIEQKENVFDLFSGTGTIAQLISKYAKNVYSIEIVEEAVKKAVENSKINNISNIKFLCGDVFTKLDELNEKVDVIILDPPRPGVLVKNIEKLVKYNANNFIYISCNPVTLASDIKEFENRGYILKKVCVVDMFPFTKHVETVVLLSKLDVNNI